MPPVLADRLALYLVADPEQTERDLVEDVAAAIDGGVTCVQLRTKRLVDGEAWALAVRLRDVCRQRDALFLVNDRLDLALASQADGAHLGVTDLPLRVARSLVSPGFLLGYSPETDGEARAAMEAGADYLGVGPVYATASKPDAGAAIGTDGLTRRIAPVEIPAVGIGGITADNAGAVIRAGAAGVAVIGAILRSRDPGIAAACLAASVHAAKGARHV